MSENFAEAKKNTSKTSNARNAPHKSFCILNDTRKPNIDTKKAGKKNFYMKKRKAPIYLCENIL